MSVLLSAALELPAYRYTQDHLAEATRQLWAQEGELSRSDTNRFRRIVAALGIEHRHTAYPIESYAGLEDRNTRWLEAAAPLAEAALTRAIARAGLAPEDIDTLLFASITGLATPSIDALLINRLGLGRDTKRLPSFGLGCMAGASLLARAHDLAGSRPGPVALVTVELCSLTFQAQDRSATNMVAASLFGDGAAAAIIAPSGPATHTAIVDTEADLLPGTDALMAWHLQPDGFRIVLSPELPAAIQAELRVPVERLLARHQLKPKDISHWLVHPGGPKILQAAEHALDLPPQALDASRTQLKRYGNLSSAAVIGLLDTHLTERPAPGSWAVAMAMGPGLSVELLLLQQRENQP